MTAFSTPHGAALDGGFAQRFSSTPLGARLARHLALYRLHDWGVPRGSDVHERAAVVVAELASNAVTHGRVPGREFELRLEMTAHVLWIEVSDARAERLPPSPGELPPPSRSAESGRGLALVEALADRWAVVDRLPVGKTVCAEIDLPPDLA